VRRDAVLLTYLLTFVAFTPSVPIAGGSKY